MKALTWMPPFSIFSSIFPSIYYWYFLQIGLEKTLAENKFVSLCKSILCFVAVAFEQFTKLWTITMIVNGFEMAYYTEEKSAYAKRARTHTLIWMQ